MLLEMLQVLVKMQVPQLQELSLKQQNVLVQTIANSVFEFVNFVNDDEVFESTVSSTIQMLQSKASIVPTQKSRDLLNICSILKIDNQYQDP